MNGFAKNVKGEKMSYKINIAGYSGNIYPIKFKRAILESCDREGNKVKSIGFSRGKYVNEKGEEVEKTYKKVGNKVLAKLKRTTEIRKEQIKKLPKTEIYNRVIDGGFYFFDNELLFEKLKESDECWEFAFTNGNGYCIYNAVAFAFDNLGIVIALTYGNLTEGIKKVKEQIKEHKEVKTEIVDDGIARAEMEDLLVVI